MRWLIQAILQWWKPLRVGNLKAEIASVTYGRWGPVQRYFLRALSDSAYMQAWKGVALDLMFFMHVGRDF